MNRDHAEAAFTAEATITRAAGAATFDRATGATTYAEDQVVWSGRCSVVAAGRPTEPRVGGRELAGTAWIVALSVTGTEGVQVGDIVTVTAADESPGLIGKRLTVEDVDLRSRMVTRRLACVDLSPSMSLP